MAKEYSGKDIQVLEGLDGVRKRPGMYVGGTGSAGINHLIWEIVDNSVDEAIAGYCKRIEITLYEDGSVQVVDDGRGIPVDKEAKTGLSALEVVFTKLHAGGKFGGGSYQAAGGLHGVGASVTNALSERLDATVARDGQLHTIGFRRGYTGVWKGDGPEATFTAKTGVQISGKAPKGHTGTTVRFWPDRAIFHPDAVIEPEKVLKRARQTAFLVPGLAIQVRDLTDPASPKEETFKFDGGVLDMVEFLSSGKPVCDALHLQGSGSFVENVPVLDDKGHMQMQEVSREVAVDVALKWDAGYDSDVQSFVNVVATPKGGTHVKGFERGLLSALRKGYDGTRLMKQNEDPVLLDDALEGLTAVVSVGFPEPQFEGQTKEILGTPGVTKIVQDVVSSGVKAWLEGRKKAQARLVLEKVANAARTRVAARSQREASRRKTALESASMPAKLVDCRSTGVSRSELFIVEGDSALGCFTGDTLVATAEGEPLTFAQLVEDWQAGIIHFGYATNKKGDVNIAPLIEPRVTKHAAPLVRVTLDNGKSVRCTPDHLFRLRDGSYRRADALQPGDSLMPLYREFSSKRKGDKLNGYERVWMNTRSEWVYTHYLADGYNIRRGLDTAADGNVRHHVDLDRLNNNPANIKRMTMADHLALHAALMDRERLEAGYRRYLDEEGGREAASDRMKEMWEDPDFRALCGELSRQRHTEEWFQEALHGGFQRWYASLTDEEKDAYADRMRDLQDQYWSVSENRAAAAERVRGWFAEDPTRREAAAERANAQWADPTMRAWRADESSRFFSDPAQRQRQADAVATWHAANPEWGEKHSRLMSELMNDEDSLVRQRMDEGRAEYLARTTTEERAERIRAGRKSKALIRLQALLHLSDAEIAAEYEAFRREKSPTSLTFERLLDEFGGNMSSLREAASLANHKVARVEALTEVADVYDLTVEGYHNFALEAGVFVHNSARAARNSEYQAMLPIRGKILNVQKASMAQILANAECAAIIQVIGAGSGRSFDLDAMRYHKILLMADADVDGSHIRALLIVLFAKLMRPAIEAGRLYAAVPPLYKVETTGRSKETVYAYSSSEMEQVVARLEKAGKTVKKPIPRFKGLGEMNADELWETTMDPSVRTVRQVTMGDVEEAERTLELLFGDAVAPRRDWIIENADRLDPAAIDA